MSRLRLQLRHVKSSIDCNINVEVTGSNPVEALIFFFSLLLSNCLNWKIYCDDHSSLSDCNIVVDILLIEKDCCTEKSLLGNEKMKKFIK